MSSQNIVQLPQRKLDFSDGCLIMGVLNVTPDSFSDGGKFADFDAACRQGVNYAMTLTGMAIEGYKQRDGHEG